MISFDVYSTITEVKWDWDKNNLSIEQAISIKKNFLLRLYALKNSKKYQTYGSEFKNDIRDYRYKLLSSIYCIDEEIAREIPKACINLLIAIPKLKVYAT